MVENYPTALRSLVLAENSISPELQQQICDLLSEGERRRRWQEGLVTPRNESEPGSLLPTRGAAAPGRAPVVRSPRA